MKQYIKLFLSLFLISTLTSACNKNTIAKEEVVAARIKITTESFVNSLGTISTKLWEANDKVGILNVDAKTVEATFASPITTGSPMSIFTFGIKGAKENDNLVAFYPASANLIYTSDKLETTIPVNQDGDENQLFVGKALFSSAYNGFDMTLSPFYNVLFGNVKAGDYKIKKAVLKGNNAEKIAGKVLINASLTSATADAETITVDLGTGLDCRKGSVKIPFVIAPIVFNKGYTITFTTDSNEEIVFNTDERVTAEIGGKIDSEMVSDGKSPEVLICGDNMIYHINTKLAQTYGYKNAILWEWDAKTIASAVGKNPSDMIRLDDCKLVDNNTKVLLTASKGYAALIDKETKELFWYSTSSRNAHSAELLPNNRVAVACSDAGDCIQIFDIKASDVIKFSTPLASAHGVVWNEHNQRLYAIGGTSLNVYTLTNWETNNPSLTLEKSINTSSYVTGLHDMMLVDENTLIVAGHKAALYNITQNSFTQLSHFNSSTALKSVNYNPYTGECWYTDATGSNRPLSWSCNDIAYTSNTQSTERPELIRIGDLNMYKVRVYNW